MGFSRVKEYVAEIMDTISSERTQLLFTPINVWIFILLCATIAKCIHFNAVLAQHSCLGRNTSLKEEEKDLTDPLAMW